MTKRSDQAVALRWRSARMRWIDGLRSMAGMVQNPLDDCGFLDAGDDARPNAFPLLPTRRQALIAHIPGSHLMQDGPDFGNGQTGDAIQFLRTGEDVARRVNTGLLEPGRGLGAQADERGRKRQRCSSDRSQPGCGTTYSKNPARRDSPGTRPWFVLLPRNQNTVAVLGVRQYVHDENPAKLD